MAQRNLITDVAGILVGQADDARLASGVTAIVFEEPAVAAVDVRGGAPGTRETDLLEPASHRRAHRRSGAVRRLRLRPGRRRPACRPCCANAAAALPSAMSACRSSQVPCCSTCSTAAIRIGDAFRPIASSATPPRRRPDILRTRDGGRRLRRHDRQPQGRARLGLRDHPRRPYGRRARRRERLRQRQCRPRPAFLGGAVRAWMASSAASAFR